jgi:hypothetical protein
MGNSNSGRWGGKAKCENCQSLDVRQFARNGWLKSGRQFNLTWSSGGSLTVATLEHGINLSYTINGGSTHTYFINLATSNCTYGGTREWFICPRCNDRKAKLFLRDGRFACRVCQCLRYHSQALDPMARNQWAYSRVQNKLADCDMKPKGMHWRTLKRLHDRMEVIDAKIDCAFNIMAARLIARFR